MTPKAIALLVTAALATVPQTASSAQAAPAAPPALASRDAQIVEPASVEALRRMSAYLKTLPQFEIRTETTLDLVTNDGQTVQLDGGGLYKVRRPDRFAIQISSDAKSRSFIYDGKQLTMYAPNLAYYSTVAAPGTIRETLNVMWDKFHIPLPLEDLFRWSDPQESPANKLISGFHAGTSTIDGVVTDQYVFREGSVDWQIWIQQGAQPLPRKLVIVDRLDPANPAYIARLSWNLNPNLTDRDFVFQPQATDKSIKLTQVTP